MLKTFEQFIKTRFNDSHALKEPDHHDIALAEDTSDKSTSLHGFTRQLCDAWNNSQRCELVEDLWLIALADGKIDAHERHIIRKIAALLYLTDTQIAHAKEAAKSRS